MTNLNYITKRFVKHMRRTYKNKLAAIGLLLIGIICAKLTGEAGVLYIAVALFGPLFFINVNCFYD